MLKLFEQVYQKSLQESDDSDITSVELDICDWNDSGYEDFISSVEDYGLDWNMIEEHGPGGGNPVFELTGSLSFSVNFRFGFPFVSSISWFSVEKNKFCKMAL